MERAPKERGQEQVAPSKDQDPARPGGKQDHVKQAPGRSHSVSDEDKKLNEALKESFPASDPPASGQATGREKPKSRIDREPPDIVVPTVDDKTET